MYEIEEELLSLLQNGDMCAPKVSELAKALRTSNATIHRKIKKLEKEGKIKEYVAHVDPQKLGKKITALVRVQIHYPSTKGMTHEKFIEKYVEKLLEMKEVQELYVPLGTWDFIMKVKTESMADQYKFISENIMPIGNIQRMESIVVMKTLKESSFVKPE